MAYSTSDYSASLYGPDKSLAELAGEINTINRTAQQMANLGRIPGAAGLEAQSSRNIQQQLAGQVPTDVLNMLGTQAAERGVAMGMSGSPAANAAYMRALGLTSIGQQEAGQRSLSAAYARNPAAPIFDVTSQITTPYQKAQLQLQRDQLRQQKDLAQQELALQASRQADAARAASASAARSAGGAPVSMSPGYAAPMPTAEALFGGYTPSSYAQPTFTYGTYTGPTMTAEEWAAPYTPGYQPTGSGTMYMGPLSGYTEPSYGGGGSIYMGPASGYTETGTGGEEDFYFTPEEWYDIGL